MPRAELRVAERGAVGAGAGGRGCRERRAGDDGDGQQRAGSGRGGAWASVLRSFPVWIAQCSKPNSGRPAGGGALPGWGGAGACGAGDGAGGGGGRVGGGGGGGCRRSGRRRRLLPDAFASSGPPAGLGGAAGSARVRLRGRRAVPGRGEAAAPLLCAGSASCPAREATRVGVEEAGASPMSGSSGGGSGRRIRLGSPTSAKAQPITAAASLATFCQRIRAGLPIAPYNPGGCDGAPPRAARFAFAIAPGGPECSAIVARRRESATRIRARPDARSGDPGGAPGRDRGRGAAADRVRRLPQARHRLGDAQARLRDPASAPRPTTASSASRPRDALLDELNHNLRIADGVLRFRIFKVDPRSPAIVPPPPLAVAAAAPARRRAPLAGGRARTSLTRPKPHRRPSRAGARRRAGGRGPRPRQPPRPAAERERPPRRRTPAGGRSRRPSSRAGGGSRAGPRAGSRARSGRVKPLVAPFHRRQGGENAPIPSLDWGTDQTIRGRC